MTIVALENETNLDYDKGQSAYRATNEPKQVSLADAKRLKELVLDPLSSMNLKADYDSRRAQILAGKELSIVEVHPVYECAFWPSHAIRFEYGTQYVDCVICFDCPEWKFTHKGEGSDSHCYFEPVEKELLSLIKKYYPTK